MRKAFNLFLLIFFGFYSCKNNKNFVEYYEDGSIKSIKYFNDINLIDSTVYYYKNYENMRESIVIWNNDKPVFKKYYYPNGNLMREGCLQYKDFRIGKWNLYHIDGFKSEIIEYINLNGNSYINQSWKLNKKGDTIDSGNFFSSKYDKVVINDSPIRFYFSLTQRFFIDSDLYVCLPKEDYKLKKDFSNQYEIHYDTIHNLSVIKSNHPIYGNRKYDVIFDLIPKGNGPDTLRGFLLEKKVLEKNDSIDFYTRQYYFSLPFMVKSSKN